MSHLKIWNNSVKFFLSDIAMSDNESETTATSHRDARQRDVWRGSAWHCTSRHAGPNQPHFSRQNLTAASRWRWQIAKIFGRPEIANISEDGACVAGYIICVGECRVRVVQNIGGVRPGVMILIVSTCLCYVGNQFWLHWDDSPPPALPACLLTSVGARVHWTWLGPATADTSKQIQLYNSRIITQRHFPYHLRKQPFTQKDTVKLLIIKYFKVTRMPKYFWSLYYINMSTGAEMRTA